MKVNYFVDYSQKAIFIEESSEFNMSMVDDIKEEVFSSIEDRENCFTILVEPNVFHLMSTGTEIQ